MSAPKSWLEQVRERTQKARALEAEYHNWPNRGCNECDELQVLYECAIGQYLPEILRRLEIAERALTITRGQWIHSVHAEQCLAALAAIRAPKEGA